MIDAAQEIILTPGTRQGRAQLGIRQRPTDCDHAADHPQHDQGEPGLQGHQLKAKTGEHAGANHIGDDDRKRRAWGKIGFHRNWLNKRGPALSTLRSGSPGIPRYRPQFETPGQCLFVRASLTIEIRTWEGG